MIRYMARTRDYYAAQGYQPYSWAHNDDRPWTQPAQSLADSTLALITTAAPYRPELRDQGPGAPYNADAKFYTVYTAPLDPAPDLRISHIGYDRKHCAADDPNTWLPIPALQRAKRDGMIGAIAPRLVGAPTNRSQRATLEQDAPAVLEQVQAQGAEVALLVPT